MLEMDSLHFGFLGESHKTNAGAVIELAAPDGASFYASLLIYPGFMWLTVGDIVRSTLTREEGRIVRIAKVGARIHFVVATVSKVSGKQIEGVWHPREVTEVRNHVRKYRTASGSSGGGMASGIVFRGL